MDARLNLASDAFAPFQRQSTFVATPRSKAEIDLLVLQHNALVRKIAWQVFSRMTRAIEVEDLVQIGRVALVESANTFVDRGEASFATYATMRIRGAMVDELRRGATVSRGAIRRRREFRDARDLLAGNLGREPSTAEMAQQTNMSIAAYRTAEATTHGVHYSSIDEAYSDHSDWFADRSTPDAYSVLEADRAKAAMAAAVAKLPEREQLVLQLFFVEELSLGEIGLILEVCSARVCQIKKAALARLRVQLAGWSGH